VIRFFAAFIAGAIVALVARRWRERWKREHPIELPPGVPYETLGEGGPMARAQRALQFGSIREPTDPLESAELRARELADDLRGYLGDISAQHGADDVVFWVRRDAKSDIQPIAWNHPGFPPDNIEQDRALIAWAASQGIVNFDAADATPTFAAARVPLDAVIGMGTPGEVEGALVASAPGGIRSVRGELKLWLPRHAERLAQAIELQVTRNESAKANKRMRFLVRRVRELDPSSEKANLEKHISDAMLEATDATFAALVQWNALERQGVVRYVSPMYPDSQTAIDSPVAERSMVGDVCAMRTPLRWENEARRPTKTTLYGPGLHAPSAGAIAILPMARSKEIIGAIILGSDDPRALRETDLRSVGLFAHLAGSALEAAWGIEKAGRSALVDQLTGLGNRRDFDEKLKFNLDQTDRFGGSCALVMADVDHFKAVNDDFGHAAGDRVLEALAQVIRDQLRTTDGGARVGGEEFALLLPQTNVQGAVDLAERLRANIEAKTVRLPDRNINVTASFGVAIYEAGGGVVKRGQLFAAADRALYRAKGEGRNCVRTA
jgi:diguanylate cyclase (GGDEF)-like protein